MQLTMRQDDAFELSTHPVHLGLGARAVREPAFEGPAFYAAYDERHASDGAEGRLVSQHSFDAPWTGWEMHPAGEELVLCLRGAITLIQEIDGEVRRVLLREGQAAINPRGVWHTADVDAPTTVLFITPGDGTEQRAR
jgi:hypothetical protein